MIPGTEIIERARALRAEGLTYDQLAEQLGCGRMDIWRWCQPDFKPKYIPRGTPFWDRMDKSGGPDACWAWLGGGHPSGYGQVTIAGRKIYAHRRAFELTFGEIPDGLLALHRCDNPPCCNPAHLFLGTIKDNSLDAKAKGRTRAPRGEANHFCKYTDEEIAEVRRLRAEGLLYREIADRTGVEASYASRVCNGVKRP